MAEYAAGRTAEVMNRFDNERRLGGLAVEGVTATLGALARRRVQALIVADDPDDERARLVRPRNAMCRDTGRAVSGNSTLAAGRLVDVAVRAAVVTDAQVHVLAPAQSGALTERIGALWRFSDTEP